MNTLQENALPFYEIAQYTLFGEVECWYSRIAYINGAPSDAIYKECDFNPNYLHDTEKTSNP